ncbi:unnamed protein product [Caenorhabditis sp. 36 PRJEB53466]|nr:unnamed protein product [Caenorhabditis sp. 36 PRJEB53466]
MSDDNDGASTTVDYTHSQLELLDADCKTALPFDDDLSLIKEMGRRAKAKRRAARIAADVESVVTAVSSRATDEDETDCEVPSIKRKASLSKIPVLQKDHAVARSSSSSSSSQLVDSGSASKIPRPKAHLVYLKPRSVETDTVESLSEKPSFTASDGSTFNRSNSSFTDPNPATMPVDLPSLPKCDIPSEYEPKTEEMMKDDEEALIVVAEANGVEMKLNVSSMLDGLAGLNLVGFRLL